MKRLQASLGYLILIITIVVFTIYGVTHKQLWHTLARLNILFVILILFLYFVILEVLILLLKYTVEICGNKIDIKDNARISAYSLLINFFGPLQSGPGFRALYLKRKFKISYGSFLWATLIYYLIYGSISGIIALAPSPYWRWLIVLIPLGLIVVFFAYKLFMNHQNKKAQEIKKIALGFDLMLKLAAATLIQIILLAAIYFTELKIVNQAISLRQALIYTGVANLTLFVSLTPGGIGIREAFLLFSQRLHHIPSKTIIAASVIDRAVYILSLAIIFVIVASLHVKGKLGLKNNVSLPKDHLR